MSHNQVESREIFHCSFCGRTEDLVEKLISGPSVFICDRCVELCSNIIKKKPSPKFRMLKPKEIKERLDDYIIGQDEAKKTLAVAVYNHYQRISREEESFMSPSTEDEEKVILSKSNVLLLGPTGSGKTLLAKTLADTLDVPFAIADATNLTEAGYVGEDVENIILQLVRAADYDIGRAEKGIIYIDEIDKKQQPSMGNPSITRDVSGEGVQGALLKIIEGTIANIPPKGGRKHPQQEYLQVDTSGILFIVGGAFVGLDKVIARRLGKGNMGFSTTEENEWLKARDLSKVDRKNYYLSKIESEDLIHFGMIPEFVGRFNCIIYCRELQERDLVMILKEPKNALVKEYVSLFRREGVRLSFTEESLYAVAKRAIQVGTGARGLRTILEKTLRDAMYSVPSEEGIEEIVVTKENITENTSPEIRYKREKIA